MFRHSGRATIDGQGHRGAEDRRLPQHFQLPITLLSQQPLPHLFSGAVHCVQLSYTSLMSCTVQSNMSVFWDAQLLSICFLGCTLYSVQSPYTCFLSCIQSPYTSLSSLQYRLRRSFVFSKTYYHRTIL